MNVSDLSEKIYKDEPQGPNSIRLDLDTITTNPAEIFEIISLFFLDGVERKIMKNYKLLQGELDTDKKIKTFVNKKVLLLKQYCQSIGLDFKLTILTKKDVKTITMHNTPSFYTKNKYSFFMAFLYKTHRRGKDYNFIYNPGKVKFNDIRDGSIFLNIKNNFFKIQFNYL
jgi:hypothetical protein